MTAQFIDRADVQWRQVRILRDPVAPHHYEHVFELPRPLGDWDVFDYWERERFTSIRDRLHEGSVLFDVGAEHGWCTLLYAATTGPSIVLIEPTPEFWPNIRATWERNYPNVTPLAFYSGLLSDETDETGGLSVAWPTSSTGPLIDRNSYQYIHQHAEHVHQITLDDMVARSGIVPDALTIDVEGAELNVLRGGAGVLDTHHPLVWVSIHPDLIERDYHATDTDVHDLMAHLGYTGTHLATDHEQHWLFECRP
jgi:FkbM family methyltransferase